MAARQVLVLGGARSGKSSFAERLAAECGGAVLYVATAVAVDGEMADRIAHHRARRPAAWQTLEAPTGLAPRLAASVDVTTILVEDLTLLLSNHMAHDVATAEDTTIREIEALLAIETDMILVSNEVGMGLVPMEPLSRTFRDALGRVNQAAAAACSEVYFVVAGLPLKLK